jgi:hypothetical protein
MAKPCPSAPPPPIDRTPKLVLVLLPTSVMLPSAAFPFTCDHICTFYAKILKIVSSDIVTIAQRTDTYFHQ